MSKNRLYVIPQKFGKLISLKALNLESNNLESLPASIGDLKQLVTFNVSKNRLSDVVEEICDCITLKKLNIECNQLYNLPNKLNRLSLIELKIGYNRIEHLNESLFSYELGKSIKLFSCIENNLLDLPNSLYMINEGASFECDFNPLISPPSFLLNHELQVIQKYLKYRQIRTQEIEDLCFQNDFIFCRSHSKPYANECIIEGIVILSIYVL